jgi:hypothetical protein
MNPISSINNFLNKQFGVPLPKTKTPFYPTPTGAPVSGMNSSNASMVPANTSATGIKPPVITPPIKTTPTLPPTGKTFVQNQIQPAYDNITGARTQYGTSIGAQDMLGGKPVTPGGGTSATDATAPLKAPESPYMTYLKSMFDPEALKTTRSNIDQLNERTSDELLRSRSREDELRKNDIGQGSIGQAHQLTENARLSNRSLADLAIAKGSVTDIYNSMISAGKSVFEAETAAAKAVQDQANEDKKIGQADTQIAETIRHNTATEEGVAAKAAQDAKEFGMNYALDAKKVAIEQQKANQTDPNSTTNINKNATDAASSLNVINSLLSNSSIGAISGVPALTAFLPGTNAQLAKNQFKQIKGMLALENRSKLKGSGAVSDFESRTLESAASSLDTNLSDKEFVRQLKQVRGVIATSHGLDADVLVIDPKTKQSQIVSANSQSIANMVADNLIVEYQ